MNRLIRQLKGLEVWWDSKFEEVQKEYVQKFNDLHIEEYIHDLNVQYYEKYLKIETSDAAYYVKFKHLDYMNDPNIDDPGNKVEIQFDKGFLIRRGISLNKLSYSLTLNLQSIIKIEEITEEGYKQAIKDFYEEM